MKKKKAVSVILSLALCFSAAGCGGSKSSDDSATEAENKTGGMTSMTSLITDPEVKLKIGEIQKNISLYYLFDVDEEKRKEAIYKAVVEGLGDPYSEYYTKEEFDQLLEDNSGTYEGIGAVVTQDPDGIVSVVRPIKNSPAEEAKLMAGDIIVQVDDMEVNGHDLTEVVSKIRGKGGTEAYLKVVREGKNDYLEFHITRREVENYSVDYKMLEDQIGYVQVTEFLEKTAPEFKEAVNDLIAQGAKGFIFDLRDNPGGLVSAATEMSSFLADENKNPYGGLVLYTEGKDGKRLDEDKDTDGHKIDQPFVILMNKNSASSSEIFAGAMRDIADAKLIGTQSFGKGIVQNVIRLSDGSGMKVTFAKYFNPSGYDLHEVGLAPDYEVELPNKRQNAVNLDRKDDTQLDKAIEVVKEEMK